ncbi:lysophospholipid acyltransferase family protein [Paenibacillus sp. MMS20-IR301]|uniref:lysophospholipid acyltransferase family protein n=1 Tax=Paenibacillus sp. MMS20-IR301 TaxID=2895946 RepID=UPI0028EEDA5C|nr:lysophospholipid acyltransferase family protein [Paenibacillus sp. MMS20-IR301]WNS42607.1 lysophospholipid acyltransferase family protein [Paenibacillus sp. MMS20-IR301]
MLEAAKSGSFDRLFYRYNSLYLLRRHFHSIGISGELQPPAAAGRGIFYLMNHSSWWDGLLAYHAAGKLPGSRHYFMMEEEQLRKYAFFRRLGAYSINPGSPGDSRASLRYTAGLLQAGERVWMYPEGEILPLEHRPLSLKEGAALVLRLSPQAAVVPVTLYHGLFRHTKPEATLLAGDPLIFPWAGMERADIARRLEAVLSEQLEAHRSRIVNNRGYMPAEFKPLLRKGRSTHEWYDLLRRGGRSQS